MRKLKLCTEVGHREVFEGVGILGQSAFSFLQVSLINEAFVHRWRVIYPSFYLSCINLNVFRKMYLLSYFVQTGIIQGVKHLGSWDEDKLGSFVFSF